MANLFCNREPGLVSMVVGSYNREGYICEALDCLKNQTYKNIEVVVVDDCSTDDTGRVVHQWHQDNIDAFRNFIYLKLPRNRDEEWTFNIAFCCTSGEYIGIQHSDDLCDKERVQAQIDHLLEHPETACVGTGYQNFEGSIDNITLPVIWLSFDRSEIEKNYKENVLYCVCNCTTMFRATILEELIGYKRAYPSNDWYFIKEIVMHDYIVDNIPRNLYYYRSHKDQRYVLRDKDKDYVDKKREQIKKRVSVVLPVYRSPSGILNAFESILKQSCSDIEVVIVDELLDEKLEQDIKKIYSDCISNNSECHVKEFIYFKLPRKVGYPWIYNIGAYLSIGEYVVMHGDDGISERCKLEKQVEFLNNNFIYIAVGTNFEPENDWIKFDDAIESSYLVENEACVNLNTVMLRADIINLTGGLNQSMTGREDYEFVYWLIRDNHRIQNIRDVLYYENNM